MVINTIETAPSATFCQMGDDAVACVARACSDVLHLSTLASLGAVDRTIRAAFRPVIADMASDHEAVFNLLLSVRGDYNSGPLSRVAECSKLAWHGLNYPMGMRGLVLLARCGAFANVLQLELTACRLGVLGVIELVDSVFVGDAMPCLQHLSLRDNGISNAGAKALVDAIGRGDCSFGNLITCDLSQNGISDKALSAIKAALAAVPSMRRLFYSNDDGWVCHSLTAAHAYERAATVEGPCSTWAMPRGNPRWQPCQDGRPQASSYIERPLWPC